MRKSLFIIAMLVPLILGACTGQTQVVTPQPSGGEAVQPSAQPAARTPTRPPTLAAPTGTSAAGSGAGESASTGCTVQSPFPTAGPTEQLLFPPAGEDDWTLGPDDAQTTLTEYSDFQ